MFTWRRRDAPPLLIRYGAPLFEPRQRLPQNNMPAIAEPDVAV
jgi:hypothetical protein